MTRADHRLHIAAAIACASTVAWIVGLNQASSAFRGPEGMPAPILWQAAVGLNAPADMVQHVVRRLPILNEMADAPIVFFFAAWLLWLWLFAWIKRLRGRNVVPFGSWLSITWCLCAGSYALYRSTDVDALRTFPSLINEAGFKNAVVASGALQWHLTLMWGLFLVGSAVIAAMRLTRSKAFLTVHEGGDQVILARQPAHRPRNRKAHK